MHTRASDGSMVSDSTQSSCPVRAHRAQGRKSLHRAFFDLQGRQAACALRRVAILRAFIS